MTLEEVMSNLNFAIEVLQMEKDRLVSEVKRGEFVEKENSRSWTMQFIGLREF